MTTDRIYSGPLWTELYDVLIDAHLAEPDFPYEEETYARGYRDALFELAQRVRALGMHSTESTKIFFSVDTPIDPIVIATAVLPRELHDHVTARALSVAEHLRSQEFPDERNYVITIQHQLTPDLRRGLPERVLQALQERQGIAFAHVRVVHAIYHEIADLWRNA